MAKMCGIYLIQNIISGRFYVGMSCSISARWNQHRYALRRNNHHSKRLQNSWNKHGEAAFVFVVLEQAAVSDLADREQFWIAALGATGLRGMNVRADSRTNRGREVSDSERAAMSARARGRKHSDETKRKISVSMSARRLSDETKDKLRALQKGRKRSEETRALISSIQIGRVASAETRKKMSESRAKVVARMDPAFRRAASIAGWAKRRERVGK